MKKRILSLLLIALLLFAPPVIAEDAINIAVLKGPTGIGATYLMMSNDAGNSENAYNFTIAGAPDALVAQLVTGELDMAALPTNTIAMLNQKTDGGVQIVAVNTLGVLYLLERGEGVQTLDDLAGKAIVSAGRGTTTEVVADALFPADTTVDYVAEHAEAIAQAVAGNYDLVLLPEPFVTSLLSQDAGFRIAVDLTAAWEAEHDSLLPMGGIAVRTAFAQENPKAVNAFLAEYADSVAFANEYPGETGTWLEQNDIMSTNVSIQAIPRSNIVCLTGDDMRDALQAYYAILLESNPELIGGAMPDDAFYYAP